MGDEGTPCRHLASGHAALSARPPSLSKLALSALLLPFKLPSPPPTRCSPPTWSLLLLTPTCSPAPAKLPPVPQQAAVPGPAPALAR